MGWMRSERKDLRRNAFCGGLVVSQPCQVNGCTDIDDRKNDPKAYVG
jgi:hypothetical protein